MILKLENIELKDPQIQILSVRDNVIEKTCKIEIKFYSNTYSHVRTINGFSYTQTWDDADIENYVNKWVAENSVEEDENN